MFLFLIHSLTFSFISIKGTLKNQDMNLGGIRLEFSDSENNITVVETDVFGYFSIELEPKKYNITLKDYTLVLDKNSDKIYDFRTEKNSVFLTLEAIFKTSFISGRVVDDLNNSIPFSKVKIDSGKFSKNLIADEFGYFSLELPHGIFRLSANSEGFSDRSLIRNITPASSIPNLLVKLDRLSYFLEGYVTNGVEPLEDIEVKIISEKGNTLKRGMTSEKGKFFFADIPSLEKIYILVDTNNYLIYESMPLKIESNIKNFYIPLSPTKKGESP